MNNTKWEELRSRMDSLPFPVKWKSKDLNTGFIFGWDSDWFYHFRLKDNIVSINSYKSIEWVEILFEKKREDILSVIKEIHLPGEIGTDSVKIYGYIEESQYIDFI